MSILTEIRKEKEREVSLLTGKLGLTRPSVWTFRPRGLVQALEDSPFPAIIAEVKRASPSRGDIRNDLSPTEVGQAYDQAGASAISVLTDEKFFKGQLSYLSEIRSKTQRVNLLRKDFILHRAQIWESREAGADAILLILSFLSDEELLLLAEEAIECGLDILFEIHDRAELERLFLILPRFDSNRVLLGINNRNLHTFETRLEVTHELAPLALERLGEDCPLIVAESGITTSLDITGCGNVGCHVFLIGESLMARGDPGANLRKLIQDIQDGAREISAG